MDYFDAEGSGSGAPVALDAGRVRRDPHSVVVGGDASALPRSVGGGVADGPDEILLGARLYDPELGRFLQPDTLSAPYARSGKGLDRYRFAWNSPPNYGDPTGTWEIPYVVSLAVGPLGVAPALVPQTMGALAQGLGPLAGGGRLGFAPGSGGPSQPLPIPVPQQGEGGGGCVDPATDQRGSAGPGHGPLPQGPGDPLP